MKRISLIAASMLMMGSVASANTTTEDRILSLEKELTSLKTELKNYKSDTSEILDEVEKSSLTDKIKFGLTFKTRYDGVVYDNKTLNEKETDRIFTTKVNLNMKSDISEDVKFTGRLTMNKKWGNNYNNMYSSYDSKQGRISNDSSVFMERAYVDWIAYKGDVPVYLTIGRQPSSEGPSYQYSENSVRKGTYDALIFDGAADGIVSTIPMVSITGDENSALRFAFGKGVENESYESATGQSILKDNNVYGVFYDMSIPYVENSLVQFSYAKATDIVADSNALNTPSVNVGDFSWYGVLLEANNIKDTGLDLFFHYAHSKGKSNGSTVGFDVDGNGTVDANIGLVDKTGHAFWTGARYDLKEFGKIGVEYNRGSKYWFSMTSGSTNPLNKLATRGDAYDIYYVKEVAKNTHVKVGYLTIDEKFSGSGYHVGPSTRQDNDIKNVYGEFVINF